MNPTPIQGLRDNVPASYQQSPYTGTNGQFQQSMGNPYAANPTPMGGWGANPYQQTPYTSPNGQFLQPTERMNPGQTPSNMFTPQMMNGGMSNPYQATPYMRQAPGFAPVPPYMQGPTIIVQQTNTAQPQSQYMTLTSDKSKDTAFILCLLGFVGLGGIHDFYLGKSGSGLLKLVTVNWFGIGTVLDLITIASGGYKDNVGAPLRK